MQIPDAQSPAVRQLHSLIAALCSPAVHPTQTLAATAPTSEIADLVQSLTSEHRSSPLLNTANGPLQVAVLAMYGVHVAAVAVDAGDAVRSVTLAILILLMLHNTGHLNFSHSLCSCAHVLCTRVPSRLSTLP